MAKKMKNIAILSLLLTICSIFFYTKTKSGFLLSLSITFVTISYHFLMRLFVGWIIDKILHNHVDYRQKWFQVSKTEQKFYQMIKVNKWKKKMPTYDATVFDQSRHSWDEIAQATCQAELVHEIIMILSFLPVLFSRWLGALPVFVVTSVLSAGVDVMFVMMQRFNRNRIVKRKKR